MSNVSVPGVVLTNREVCNCCVCGKEITARYVKVIIPSAAAYGIRPKTSRNIIIARAPRNHVISSEGSDLIDLTVETQFSKSFH